VTQLKIHSQFNFTELYLKFEKNLTELQGEVIIVIDSLTPFFDLLENQLLLLEFLSNLNVLIKSQKKQNVCLFTAITANYHPKLD
jgi:hypothetical protein